MDSTISGLPVRRKLKWYRRALKESSDPISNERHTEITGHDGLVAGAVFQQLRNDRMTQVVKPDLDACLAEDVSKRGVCIGPFAS